MNVELHRKAPKGHESGTQENGVLGERSRDVESDIACLTSVELLNMRESELPIFLALKL